VDGVQGTATQSGVDLAGAQPTRRDALTRWLRPVGATGVVFGAGAAGATVAFARGASGLTHRDREVLEFLAGLEQLESSFYAAALSAGKLTGEPLQFAQTVGREERAHLSDLVHLLGGHGPSAGHHRFDRMVKSNASFVAAATTLEDTVVAAYNGQAENVTRRTLARIARIMSVESRHAAWARGLAGKLPAPVAVDAAIDADAAMKALHPLLGGAS